DVRHVGLGVELDRRGVHRASHREASQITHARGVFDLRAVIDGLLDALERLDSSDRLLQLDVADAREELSLHIVLRTAVDTVEETNRLLELVLAVAVATE